MRSLVVSASVYRVSNVCLCQFPTLGCSGKKKSLFQGNVCKCQMNTKLKCFLFLRLFPEYMERTYCNIFVFIYRECRPIKLQRMYSNGNCPWSSSPIFNSTNLYQYQFALNFNFLPFTCWAESAYSPGLCFFFLGTLPFRPPVWSFAVLPPPPRRSLTKCSECMRLTTKLSRSRCLNSRM